MAEVKKTAPTPYKIPFSQKLGVGAVAGVVGTSCIFPLDMVKTRLQSQGSGADKIYRNPIHCFQTILRKEGVLGFYRGLGPNLVGVMPEKAIKLAANDLLREMLTDEATGELPLARQALAGAGAGFFQVIATNPMEISKIRLQMQATLPKAEQLTAMQVVKGLGLRGLYRGAPATLARDVPYSLLFFPGYSNLRAVFEDEDGECSMGATLFSGGASAAMAAGLCTPMDVVKTRLQVKGGSERYAGLVHCTRTILAEEGVGAFYKGAVPRMSTSAPLFGIALLAFELQKDYIRSQQGGGGGKQGEQ